MKKSNVVIKRALIDDADEILKLQKLAYISEAKIYSDYSIPPLTQTLQEVRDDFKNNYILKATLNGVIIGSVRGQLMEDACYIGRLMVHPDYQNKGVGTRLMQAIQREFKQVKKYSLITGHRSERNLHLYKKLGYKQIKTEKVNEKVDLVHLEKPNTV
jgi:ribosomal protein S18 acetylase RimI-like enzyme